MKQLLCYGSSQLRLLVTLYLFVSSIHGGSCVCPPDGENIELSSDARIFDGDGSLTGQADTDVARLGDTVIFTCRIRDTDLVWQGSVVGGVGTAIVFNSSVMPGDIGAVGQAQGGAVVATLTEANTTTNCRTSTLMVDTSGVALGTVQCTNEAFDPLVSNRLESTEPPPSPSNIVLSSDTCTSVGVEWTEPASSDLPVTNYTITVTNLDTSTDLPMITETGTTTSLTGLMVGVNYRVEIVSNDVIGPGGSATEVFIIDTLIPPTNVEYQLECRTSTQAEITWQLAPDESQGPLTPLPTAVRVCWMENGGTEQCSIDLPPDTTNYTLNTAANSEYSVRVVIDNGCSTADSSLDDGFDAAVVQDVTVTRSSMNEDAVAFNMEFAQCWENTTNWDVEVSYRPITGICTGDNTTFDFPVDLTEREEFNNVTCTRDYTYTVNVTDGSGTQVGEANVGTFDTDALPFDCDPNDLGGIADNDINPTCADGSTGSASIQNGVVCYNGVIVQSEALYICNTGYEVPQEATNPRVCQMNGVWSGSVITCVEVEVTTQPPTTSSSSSSSPTAAIGGAVAAVVVVVVGGLVVNLLLIVLLSWGSLLCCLVKSSEVETGKGSTAGAFDDKESRAYKNRPCILILLVVLVIPLPFVIYFYCCWRRKSGSPKTDDKVELNVRAGSDSGDTRSSPEAGGGDLNYAVPSEIKREEYPGTCEEYTLVDKSRKKLKPEDTQPGNAAYGVAGKNSELDNIPLQPNDAYGSNVVRRHRELDNIPIEPYEQVSQNIAYGIARRHTEADYIPIEPNDAYEAYNQRTDT